MKTLPLLLGFQLTVRIPEIIIALLGAIILGITLHYFWSSRHSIRIQKSGGEEGISENDNWKLKYYNDMDMQEKAQDQLRQRLADSKENEQILSIEIEELQKQVRSLKLRLSEQAAQPLAPGASPGSPETATNYMSELRSAQENLMQHNQHINRLLEQIQHLKDSERKYLDLQKANEQLSDQLAQLRSEVSEKEAELRESRQQHRLTEEITQRMERAYAEYNTLQEKLQKLEAQLGQPHNRNIDYEQLQASYFNLTKDFDEAKGRQSSLWEENQRLSRLLSDTEDKLKEANFQRQQLQKKTNFLEELNRDLQEVAEHNKKLESQLNRISEMEAILSRIVSDKKDYQQGDI